MTQSDRKGGSEVRFYRAAGPTGDLRRQLDTNTIPSTPSTDFTIWYAYKDANDEHHVPLDLLSCQDLKPPWGLCQRIDQTANFITRRILSGRAKVANHLSHRWIPATLSVITSSILIEILTASSSEDSSSSDDFFWNRAVN